VAVESGGVEALFDKSRVDKAIERAVLSHALDYPAHGQVRVSNDTETAQILHLLRIM